MSWIKDFISATSDAEAPDSYFYWAAIAALSGTVANRVWIHKRYYKLYPNMFIFIISKLSGLGKGVPVAVAKNVMVEAGTARVITGQLSIQGVMAELSEAHTTKTGRIINTAEATLISGEFGALLLNDPKLFTNLTDLYDSQYNEGDWTRRLRKEQECLRDPCITGLFAANEVHFREALPFHAVKGGFLGRSICVFESKRRKLDSLISDDPTEKNKVDPEMSKKLAKHLIKLSEVKGEFDVSHDAAVAYNSWYHEFYRLDKELVDDTGTAERLRDSILKVSMLLSLAEGFTLKIEQRHIEEALIHCYQVYKSAVRLVIGEGKSNVATQTKAVLKLILNQNGKKITRQSLLIRGLQTGDFDSIELDRVIEHLSQTKIVKMSNEGKHTWYSINMENVNALLKMEGDEK